MDWLSLQFGMKIAYCYHVMFMHVNKLIEINITKWYKENIRTNKPFCLKVKQSLDTMDKDNIFRRMGHVAVIIMINLCWHIPLTCAILDKPIVAWYQVINCKIQPHVDQGRVRAFNYILQTGGNTMTVFKFVNFLKIYIYIYPCIYLFIYFRWGEEFYSRVWHSWRWDLV